MAVIIIWICVSMGLVIGVRTLAGTRLGMGGAFGLSILVGLLALFCFSFALLIQVVGTCLILAVCAGFDAKPKIVGRCAAAMAAVSFAAGMAIGWPGIQELSRFREEFPAVSIANRLSYEKRPDLGGSTPIAISPEVKGRLGRTVGDSGGNMRRATLKYLHERTADAFVAAQGFGYVRMMPIRRKYLELPETQRIRLPMTDCDPQTILPKDGQKQEIPKDSCVDAAEPSVTDLLKLHDRGLDDFLDLERMGYVKDRDYVAGFQSHRFSEMPQDPFGTKALPEWEITRLDLLSLLKHETPVAYVSEYLPEMDQFNDAPTRPLDPFETQSLEKLRQDEDLIFNIQPRHIRMLGSLRSSSTCLNCHWAKEGELIGAFSYHLQPIGWASSNDQLQNGTP